MAARERHRKRLLELKAEILAEGDIDIEPGRHDATAVGSDEDAQPLTEMSQTIASSRNRNRSAVLARVVAALARLDADPEMFGLLHRVRGADPREAAGSDALRRAVRRVPAGDRRRRARGRPPPPARLPLTGPRYGLVSSASRRRTKS